jgi:hypothetical protein
MPNTVYLFLLSGLYNFKEFIKYNMGCMKFYDTIKKISKTSARKYTVFTQL